MLEQGSEELNRQSKTNSHYKLENESVVIENLNEASLDSVLPSEEQS